MKIAVLMACHDRREMTLACLAALFASDLPAGITIKAVLVDDGSSDGTAEMVASQYPQVSILHGDGSLYWGRSMHMAFEKAMEDDYDAYLWLNDDTNLNTTAISTLINTLNNLPDTKDKACIVVGSTCDPKTKELSYGGVVPGVRWLPLLRLINIEPSPNTALECFTMNGNCVLIPKSVSQSVGNIDYVFEHGTGDFDYGLRARKLGFKIYVCPGFIGTCAKNPITGTFRDRNIPRLQRLKNLHDKKQSPMRSRYIFVRRHGGFLWPVYFLFLYLRAVI